MHVFEITPAEAAAQLQAGACLIDVREPSEWESGVPVGAMKIRMSELLEDIPNTIKDKQIPLFLICASGKRSLLAAYQLQGMGYTQAYSVVGGVQRWCQEGYAWQTSSVLDVDARERYKRHLQLPEVGEAGQLRMQNARVLVVGAGGLGSPAAFYLASAGVGTLRLVDFDCVEKSNLQRQILHTDDRVGQAKVTSAEKTLKALNPRVKIEALECKLDSSNVVALLDGVDVVVDGTDNFNARYCLNEACVREGKPLVYAAIHRFEAQVSVFWNSAPVSYPQRPCYRCLFPVPPQPEQAPNCSEVGVLGVLPGIAGTLQAAEVLKIILGIGELLVGRILHFDVRAMRFRETRLPCDPQCPSCGGVLNAK